MFTLKEKRRALLSFSKVFLYSQEETDAHLLLLVEDPVSDRCMNLLARAADTYFAMQPIVELKHTYSPLSRGFKWWVSFTPGTNGGFYLQLVRRMVPFTPCRIGRFPFTTDSNGELRFTTGTNDWFRFIYNSLQISDSH